MTHASIDRRTFIAGLGAAAAMAPIRLGAAGANDRIGLGVIGCGIRGSYVLGEALAAAGDRLDVVGVADVWSVNRESFAAQVESRYNRPRPKQFTRYRDLLAMKDLDAVIITTPDFGHPAVLIDAVDAGKDAYVEKPLCARLEDAVAAVDVVKASTAIVQVGTQRRSSPRFQAAAEYVRSGELGPVCKIETAWNRNVPSWRKPLDDCTADDVDWEQYLMYQPPRPFEAARLRSWQWFYANTTGLVGLLGSHMIDVGQWFMDDPYPSTAVALGGTYTWKDGREISDTAEYVFDYPKGWILTFSSRLGSGPESDYTVIYGSRRTLDTRDWTIRPAGNTRAPGATDEVLPDPSPSSHASLTQGGAPEHVANWIACMISRHQPTAPIEVGYSHAVACCLGREAERTGRRMRYDHGTRTIAEAARS